MHDSSGNRAKINLNSSGVAADAIGDYPDFLLDASEELSQEDSLAMSDSAYAASPPPEQKSALKVRDPT